MEEEQGAQVGPPVNPGTGGTTALGMTRRDDIRASLSVFPLQAQKSSHTRRSASTADLRASCTLTNYPLPWRSPIGGDRTLTRHTWQES